MGARRCYLVERYLNVLNKYVRNRVWPETCMANGYMYDEALGFYIEYFALYPHTWHWMWDPNEKEANNNEVLKGRTQFKKLSVIELEGIHDYITQTWWQLMGYTCVCFTLTNCFQCYGPIHNSCLMHASRINVHKWVCTILVQVSFKVKYSGMSYMLTIV